MPRIAGVYAAMNRTNSADETYNKNFSFFYIQQEVEFQAKIN